MVFTSPTLTADLRKPLIVSGLGKALGIALFRLKNDALFPSISGDLVAYFKANRGLTLFGCFVYYWIGVE